MPAQYDILIAGGGMVGASLACALGRLDLSVAVVEAVPFDGEDQPSFDDRTLALSRSSQRILDALGIWPDMAGQAVSIRRIHVSERGRFGSAVIDADEQRVPALGHVIGSRELGHACWSQMRAQDAVRVITPARVTQAAPGAELMTVSVEHDGRSEPLAARLLVVADGAGSPLRAQLGIDAQVRSYEQTAIIGNVEVSQPGDGHTAYERFTADGPLALLPAGGNRFVFILTRSSAAAPDVLAFDDAQFIKCLQAVFGRRLGRFRRIGKRVAYPLSLVRAERVTAPRAVIVGNAANALHPVAGQGYNLSLRDVAALAELIADDARTAASEPAPDPGAPAVLDAFCRWRRRDQRNVAAFTDGLIRLFGMSLPGTGAARGLGLAAFDMLPAAKRELARHTMGLAGRQSRLARGQPL